MSINNSKIYIVDDDKNAPPFDSLKKKALKTPLISAFAGLVVCQENLA